MRAALILALLALAACAPAAAAQSTDPVPPGNAGIDQYADPLQDSDGERPFGSAGGSGGAGGNGGASGRGTGGELGDGSILSADTRAALAGQGPDGFRVAAVTDSTAPRDGRSRGGAGTPGADGEQETAGAPGRGGEGGGSRIAASAEALNGAAPGGMGAWLPVILVAWAIAAVVAAVLTRRGSGGAAAS